MIARFVGPAVHVGVVVDGDPVLVVEEVLLADGVAAVVVDGDRAGPGLPGPLDRDRLVEAGEGERPPGGVERAGVRVALVVERDRDVGHRPV